MGASNLLSLIAFGQALLLDGSFGQGKLVTVEGEDYLPSWLLLTTFLPCYVGKE